MKKETDNIDRTLYAYLRGEANADEIKRLIEWLGESPDNRRQYHILQNFWTKTSLKVDLDGKDILYERLRSKIEDDQRFEAPRQIGMERRKPSFFFTFRGIAASIVLAAAIIAGFLAYDHIQRAEPIASNPEPEWVVARNKPGEKSRLLLSDGTLVWLNSESELTYPPNFNGSEREVSLTGEAFFEVAKNPEKPFVVRSGSLKTTALGTSFNVSSFAEEENIVVSLVTGKVKISSDKGDVYFLEPGYQMNYSKSLATASKTNFNIANVISWKDGILVFNKSTFPEVKKKLERWYAVKIDAIGEPPADFVITGQISPNESLELALENLRYGRHFNYRINGKHVTIDFN